MKNQFVEIPANKQSTSLRRPIYGVGINDAAYQVNITSPSGEKLVCPYYQKWADILQRTHSEKYFIRYPTYRGCTICIEWLKFSAFKSWMIKQDWVGKCLDKDVIKPGNKHYSPEYCVFVSQHVNLILTDRKRFRGELPIGVSAKNGSFFAVLSVNKKTISLGCHDTKEEAANAYGTAKHDAILDLASKQSDIRIINGLKIHAKRYLDGKVK